MTKVTIARLYHSEVVVVADGAAESAAFDFAQFRYLSVTPLTALNGTPEVALKSAPDAVGTFLPVVSGASAVLEITNVAQNERHIFPAGVEAAKWLKLWLQNSGTDADQTGAKSFLVEMKS